VIFHCGSGKRSATAADMCLAKGIAHHAHLAGGIGAWKAAGLATIRIDAATGRVSAQR
jgi:rhodanese-related sulfurtransferase